MRHTISSLTDAWKSTTPPFRIALALWLAGMISIPILRWTLGPERIVPIAVPLTVLLQAGVVLVALLEAWGPLKALRAALIIVLGTYLAELIGSRTGVPFGHYDYTALIQPQLGGVPLIIPAAWLMMLPPAWAVAARISGGWRLPLIALIGAGAITAWDLYLDPQMVGWGLWVWQNPSGYFGIPWVNFAGWLLTAALITLVVTPQPFATKPLWLVYGITWIMNGFALAFFWGLPGPAAAGFAVMGVFVAISLWRGDPPENTSLI